jgi:hypothetical protein
VLAVFCGNILVFARVKERIDKDAASGKCRDAAARERERLSALSVAQLKAELVARDILAAGLVERGELVAALLAPPSAASQVRMKEQLRDIVEKVSYIGMPASPHVLVWGRLPLHSYRKGSAVLGAFPDNDLMGSGAMWCRDGHGWCGDEVPHGATAEMTDSRRRGPYMQVLQGREGEDEDQEGEEEEGEGEDEAQDQGEDEEGDEDEVDEEGEEEDGGDLMLGSECLTDDLSDGRWRWKHRPIDTSGVNDMQLVGFPLRWRMDLRVLFSRPEDVAGSLDYVEVRGCWALGTINTAPKRSTPSRRSQSRGTTWARVRHSANARRQVVSCRMRSPRTWPAGCNS